jgi:hypothetical protein
MENWIDAKGFEGYYEVSNTGHVRRKKSETVYKDGRIAHFSETSLKETENKKGYLRVYLSVKSKKYTKSVHRIVAESFIDNPDHKLTVNHKDLNKKNNNVLNLEWATNKENMKHAFNNGVYKERDKTTIKNLGKYSSGSKGVDNSSSKLIDSDILMIRHLYSHHGISITELSKQFFVSKGNIDFIVKNKTWKHLL